MKSLHLIKWVPYSESYNMIEFITMEKIYLIHCWIEHPIRPVDQLYTYYSSQELLPGMRIKVDFNNRVSIGFIEEVEERKDSLEAIKEELGVDMKPVLEVLDEEPLITDELHSLAMFLKETTLSTTISCFQAMLPSKIKPISSNQTIVNEQFVKVSDIEVSLTPKQLDAFLYVKEKGEVSYTELRKAFPNQAKALIDKGALIRYEKEKEAEAFSRTIIRERLPLNDEQKAVMDEFKNSNEDVYLLRGVTGSGKTEVYLQLAEEVLKENKQVLILVPEIGLTPQMIDRVSSRFGVDLAIYHSGLNAQEKYEQYKKVKNNQASIIVGTRSAVFLPFTNLGLIVIDEEHDGSYKQENQPAYHCRDVAIFRGKYHHCKVLLGSATPSLESYARAMKGVYHLLKMEHRINDQLPTVSIISMKDALANGESFILSNTLKEKIQDRLDKHQQIILLLNRRGYHSILKCKTCGEVIRCPHCDIAMSYHREDKMMKCHTCGTSIRVSYECKNCGSREGFMKYGFGTERLEEELQASFKDAKLLRMDRDTTTKKNSHKDILERFGNHEADILLGTQMIAKGLDYPDVTLVGVVNGDEGLTRTDYRSCEVTFDLLMQAAGRSGRSDVEGEVVLQVYDPNHYAVVCAANQDYETIFQYEMKYRHEGLYPP
ncbi:MAG: primosomal protein N', partial [Solobacterium sp.]|nr:primosomal protein N' [Solobacterium sp.]